MQVVSGRWAESMCCFDSGLAVYRGKVGGSFPPAEHKSFDVDGTVRFLSHNLLTIPLFCIII